ncbi:hypothetical protein SAMN04487949_1333 [Halogranum gelatinilyticum]|uniref:Uncharacterized protein n=1 Tax=Halogranum gelatinilyticum TaxID=660521 RepID=A0A1G9RIT3_9EURY|nr:hypothetical protein [Halogranum gelatinilyticum]SDM22355.1 hypothetical protein SAMN04487949_1333 [Halogranum gelatinilyticum]
MADWSMSSNQSNQSKSPASSESLTQALLAGIGLMIAFDVLGYQLIAVFVAAVFLVGLLVVGATRVMQLETSPSRDRRDG